MKTYYTMDFGCFSFPLPILWIKNTSDWCYSMCQLWRWDIVCNGSILPLYIGIFMSQVHVSLMKNNKEANKYLQTMKRWRMSHSPMMENVNRDKMNEQEWIYKWKHEINTQKTLKITNAFPSITKKEVAFNSMSVFISLQALSLYKLLFLQQISHHINYLCCICQCLLERRKI